MKRLALVRINYSQLYGMYKDLSVRDIFTPCQLLALASATIKNNIETKIFDGEIDLLNQKELSKDILKWNPDFVGITTTTPDILECIELAKYLKQANPKIKIIFGGPHVSAFPKDVYGELIDHIVVFDGEKALVDIVKDKRKEKIIKGAICDIRNTKLPHHLLDYSKYTSTDPFRGSLNSAQIMTTRGCPFQCIFCFHSRNIRYIGLDTIIEEISDLYNKYNVRYLEFTDDTFLLNKERVRQLLDFIKKYDDLSFQILTRADLVTKNITKMLKEAGCGKVSMGVESGSEKILKIVKKGVTKDQYRRACDLLIENDIEPRGSFIIGHPYDTEETVQETIDFAKELELYQANFNIMTPYPGTPAYKMALNGEGICFSPKEAATNWKLFRRFNTSVIRTEELSKERIEELHKIAQIDFYAQQKIYDHYFNLYKKGNKSKFFFRPLNFAWKKKFGKSIPYWKELI